MQVIPILIRTVFPVAYNIRKALSSPLSPVSNHTSSGRLLEGSRRNMLSDSWSEDKVDCLPSKKQNQNNLLCLKQWKERWWLFHFASCSCWFSRSTPTAEGDWILLVIRGQSGREAKHAGFEVGPVSWQESCLCHFFTVSHGARS